jgi:Family of unknown function (DUF5522)
MAEPVRGSDSPVEPEPLADRVLTEPHPDRLSPARGDYADILVAHATALRTGAGSYVDPASGLTVLTAGYLAARGYCCESGCRHCPYLI